MSTPQGVYVLIFTNDTYQHGDFYEIIIIINYISEIYLPFKLSTDEDHKLKKLIKCNFILNRLCLLYY